MSIAFGGVAWPIIPSNFNLGLTAAGSSECIGAVIGVDMGVGGTLLGDDGTILFAEVRSRR